MQDHLSRLLDLISVRAVVTGSVSVSRPWRAHTALAEPMKFCAIARGGAVLRTDGIDESIMLEEGDVALLRGRSWLSLHAGDDLTSATQVPQPEIATMLRLDDGDPAAADIFIGGRIDLDEAGHQVLDVLPPVTHVRAGDPSAARMHHHVRSIGDEISTGLPGSEFAVRQYAHLLALDALRAAAGTADLPPGWLRLLADAHLRPALDLIHADPGESHGLEDLARATAMSRTMFAVRFREAAGMPPIAYRTQWRMLLARRHLQRTETLMRPLAKQLGYSSESAFSSAFKRQVGVSPHSYRTQHREARRS